ncbi:LemA family protein [Haloechinothrix sp. YIM 98757]|uniref:LemA family protein n=1 Tax=Haloechinothrix aidingensis TaxID=2752311 RepID=A0A837ZZ89_9PSEU|nr:LemA family protein [Haloechinothrix aidingensis]MBA0125926.1 LemA family protein [Haloechinothrix aidingensis]
MGIALILTLVGVLLLAAIIVFVVISTYNGLVRLRNAYKNAFAQIDVQLTRRHDLIPNLVETAKGYMQHERETLEGVISARSGAVDAQEQARNNPGDPNAMQELSGAENMLTQSLGKLFALSESYPDLKANQNMMQLSEELTSTENRVAFARQSFNDAVMAYNNKREAFPGSLIAGTFGFEAAALLEVDDPGKREAPEVSF